MLRGNTHGVPLEASRVLVVKPQSTSIPLLFVSSQLVLLLVVFDHNGFFYITLMNEQWAGHEGVQIPYCIEQLNSKCEGASAKRTISFIK